MTCLSATFSAWFFALDMGFVLAKAMVTPRSIYQWRYYSGRAMPFKVR